VFKEFKNIFYGKKLKAFLRVKKLKNSKNTLLTKA
jgi:hypothetical protein